ncbi:hypothetical protein [Burkholderia gladioli]|uniref:hypothetical protein n=1 Tax=Burkholderia gladioli TaxID=28095 RepID=UPI00202DBACA|nr:hypothetical protein [Burkholderia gladioli]URV28960.1 hypothetical protein NAL90_22485 [Burkholderia gladioli]
MKNNDAVFLNRRFRRATESDERPFCGLFGHTRLIAGYKALSRRHGAIVLKNNHEDVQLIVGQILAQVEQRGSPR